MSSSYLMGSFAGSVLISVLLAGLFGWGIRRLTGMPWPVADGIGVLGTIAIGTWGWTSNGQPMSISLLLYFTAGIVAWAILQGVRRSRRNTDPDDRPIMPDAARRAHAVFHRIGVVLAVIFGGGISAIVLMNAAQMQGASFEWGASGIAVAIIVSAILYALARAVGWVVAAALGG